MPRPTKFLERRRLRILEVLGAGGSLREAARAVGVDHATLLRWIARGKKSSPGSRWREFADEVEAVRLGDPRLVELKRGFEQADPAWVWKYLEGSEWRPEPDPSPSWGEIVITFSDGDPLPGPDEAS